MSMDTEDRQMDSWDETDLELLGLKIISYSNFLIETEAYTILDTFETIETPDIINIEKNHTDLDNLACSPSPEDVAAANTKVFYIRLSDFLFEDEKLPSVEAVAF